VWTIVQWHKPEASVVKINTDGSFHDDTLSGATWTVIRDDQGIFLKASVRRIPEPGLALMTEAEAW
jgi:hypothetical protein